MNVAASFLVSIFCQRVYIRPTERQKKHASCSCPCFFFWFPFFQALPTHSRGGVAAQFAHPRPAAVVMWAPSEALGDDDDSGVGALASAVVALAADAPNEPILFVVAIVPLMSLLYFLTSGRHCQLTSSRPSAGGARPKNDDRAARVEEGSAPLLQPSQEDSTTPQLTARLLGVVLNSTEQHTLEWSTPLVADGLSIEPGSLNIYTYPGPYVGDELGLIQSTMIKLLGQAPDLFETPDPVGAFLIHALLVCNSTPALDLAFALMEARPSLILQRHVGQVIYPQGQA